MDGHGRAPVAEDVVALDAPAPLLAHEHARVHALVDLVVADERVAAGEDGDAGAAVERDVVVLDHAAPVVAHEHAHALAIGDCVVQHVAAAVLPLVKG